MKLVSIWVSDFLCFQNQTFNFDNNVRFEFEYDEKEEKVLISSTVVEDYKTVFNKPFESVTGVVGMNGAGKSTLFKLINLVYNQEPLLSEVVFIFEVDDKKGNEKKFIIFQNTPSGYSTKNTLNIEINKNGKHIKNNYEEIKYIDLGNKFNDLVDFIDLVQINNVFKDSDTFENSYFYDEYKQKLNYSSSFRLKKFLTKKIEKNYGPFYENEENIFRELRFDFLKVFFTSLKSEQLRFILKITLEYKELEKIITKVNIPKSILISFDTFGILSNFKTESNNDFIRSQISFLFKNISNTEDINIRFEKELIINSFLHYIYFKILIIKHFDFLEKSIVPLMQKINKESIEMKFELIKKFIEEHITIEKENFKEENNLSFIPKLLNIDLNKIVLTTTPDFTGRKINYNIDLNEFNSRNLIETLLNIQEDNVEPFFQFFYNNMSKGEEVFIKIFNDIYRSLLACKNESVIFLFDEIDLHLHAEWQKEMIDNLLKVIGYFVNQFNEKYNKNIQTVQIIFSTHSAFLLSDLSKYNLILLEKDNEGKSIVKPLEEYENTFGANIFDIYKNSFFVNSGFIGQYATNKINDAFKTLNKALEDNMKPSENERKQISDLIDIIGEPFIKAALVKLYDKVFETAELEVELIDKKIKELEKRKQNIKK